MKPRLLDLFCGAGGATKGYQLAGFHVTGVDIEPQENYCGDDFVQMDAVDAVFSRRFWGYFDAFHASPPCQFVSAVTPDRSKHLNLIPAMHDQLLYTGCPYVIENVERARAWLRDPIRLCGSSFGLPLHRHRLFETNFPVMAPPCAHGQLIPKFDVYEHGRWYMGSTVKVYGSGGGKANEHWAEAMGIDWMTHPEMAEAIPPAYTELIGHQLMQTLRHAAAA